MKIRIDLILQIQQNGTIGLVLPAGTLIIAKLEFLKEFWRVGDHRFEQSRVHCSQVLTNLIGCPRAQVYVAKVINNKTPITTRALLVWLVPVAARTSANRIEYLPMVEFLL